MCYLYLLYFSYINAGFFNILIHFEPGRLQNVTNQGVLATHVAARILIQADQVKPQKYGVISLAYILT